MRTLLLFASALLFLCVNGLAQTRTVTGKVTNVKDGSPVAGATIRLKGSSGATSADLNGVFSIKVTDSKQTLIVSAIGFDHKEVIATNDELTVSLNPAAAVLSDVVVTGYGSSTKRNLTGNIASVSGKSIENVPVNSFESAVQGRAAGVFVEAGNGKPGQAITVRIRGASSVSAGTQPLYVIDGVPLTTADLSSNGAPTNPLSDINPNDIQSVDILKDASAAAIYGSRAANGVVLITTRQGRAGKTKFNVNFQTGNNKPTHLRHFLSSKDYVDLETETAIRGAKYDFANDINGYGSEEEAIDDYLNNPSYGAIPTLQYYAAYDSAYLTGQKSTDWQAQAFQTSHTSQVDFNASGGTDKTTFYLSGQYLDQDGLLIGNSFKRYSTRLNIEQKASDRFKFGLNIYISKSRNNRVPNDDQFTTPLQIVALSPITPVIDPRTGLTSGSLPGAASDYPVYFKPLLYYENAYYHTDVFRTIANGYSELVVAPHLNFRTELGADNLSQDEDEYAGHLTFRDFGTPNGYGYNAYTNIFNYNTNNYFTYKNKFGEDHTLEAVAGMSFQKSTEIYNTAQGQQFPSDAYTKLVSAAQKTDATSNQLDYSHFCHYFARATYQYKERYLLNVSGRIDGSSRFGANDRYGFFPAISAGWIITEEPFMANNEFFSNLKLRASYGLTGNGEIGNYASRGLYSGAAGYNGAAGQHPYQIPNPDLHWETTAQTDIGVDFGFFKNRLSGQLDFYRKDTRDLLLNVNVPGTTGFTTQTRNAGKMYNQGIEVVLNSENFIGEFRWSTSLNFAWNVNKITDLLGQTIPEGINWAMEGQPIGVFYGREFAGADPANGDAVWYLNTKKADGSIDRTPTNDYNLAQEVVLGNPSPKYIYGITNDFSYKGFSLNVLLQGVYGNKIFNGGGEFMSANASNGYDNQTTDQLNYWKKPGDITMVPEPRQFFANGTQTSSRYLSPGSYLRVKTVTLSYNILQRSLKSIAVDHIRLFVTGQNLFTITKYDGWDPEVNADYSATNITLGNDFYSVPQARTIVFGVNIGF